MNSRHPRMYFSFLRFKGYSKSLDSAFATLVINARRSSSTDIHAGTVGTADAAIAADIRMYFNSLDAVYRTLTTLQT